MADTATRVKMTASDPGTGLTVADLFQFVQACDAHGVDPRTPVKVRVGFRAQVKVLELAPQAPATPTPPA